ncbi:hypothetical protein QTP88_014385 [Uroleucon formosanum]
MRSISYYFLRGETTVRNIIETTSKALWEILQPLYMPIPDQIIWKTIADRYNQLWNLPNCVDSIDGKHIRIKAPVNSGSSFFNYKGYFSIVLMATADADGKFITIDVGEYGRNSDGRVFKECTFGQLLLKNKLNLPKNSCLPHEENDPAFPYYFVADEAFPLLNNVMRPYPRRSLTNIKRIFNYRGRKSVECAFGMMASKFKILERSINFKTERIETVIKAVCVLHNFIRVYDGKYSIPREIQQEDVDILLYEDIEGNLENNRTRPSYSAMEIRERLCQYFVKPYAALPWQNKYTI